MSNVYKDVFSISYLISKNTFYIYLDTSPLLVSSGSEDHIARVWDRSVLKTFSTLTPLHDQSTALPFPIIEENKLTHRHWGCEVATLHHDQCVNCVAFSPTNPALLVTVSDDNTIKMWMSKAEQRKCVSNWKRPYTRVLAVCHYVSELKSCQICSQFYIPDWSSKRAWTNFVKNFKEGAGGRSKDDTIPIALFLLFFLFRSETEPSIYLGKVYDVESPLANMLTMTKTENF